MGVVFGSKRLGCNPDNVATPLAASFGDLLTLTLLAYCSQLFYSVKGKRDEDYLVHFLYWPADGSGTLKLTSMHPRVTFFFFAFIDFYPFVLYLAALFCACLVPLWVFIASKHPASQILLRTGWAPIIVAMVISRYAPHLCI